MNEKKDTDSSSDEAPLSELARLRGQSAPADFGKKIEETISKRSAGRFFGRKTFGEKLPLVGLAVVALLLALLALVFLGLGET
jgi:hypothetical protein